MDMIKKDDFLATLDKVHELVRIGKEIDESSATFEVYRLVEKGMRSVLDQMPIEEIEPVIRCRDCKHLDWSHGASEYYCRHWDTDCYEEAFVEPDDFCSHAEKREKENQQ